MNAALQNLEIKVENGGTTPQGRLTSSEWNILVAAVKALDADSDNADVSDVLQIVENAGYATQDWVNGKLTGYATQSSLNALSLGILGKADQTYVENTFVKLATAQDIAARHNFVDGLKIGDLPIYKSQDKTIYIDGNLVVSGSFTMFGKDSTTFPTIWANIPFDDTMRWDGSRWSVVASTGGGGGGTGGGISIADVESYLTTNGYATQSWVSGKGYFLASNFTKANIKSTLGISDWALESAKPTYAYSEISGTPTSLKNPTALSWSGYSSGSYDGSTAQSITIPNNTNQLANGAGFITASASITGNAATSNRLLTLDGKAMVYQTASILYVGDNSYLSTPTHILGKSIRLRYGASATTGLELTEAGNIAIGGTTATDKLHVYGAISSENANADAGFRARGSTYALFFGIGSGNVNRGIYDDYHKGWWIMRGADKTTTIDGSMIASGLRINQTAFDDGLILNRTAANSGVGIVAMSNNVRLGTFGINGTKTFEISGGNGIVAQVSTETGNAMIIHGGGSYKEGIRLANRNGKTSTWSGIHLGCDPSATEGTHSTQWFVGRNGNNNYFVVRNNTTDYLQIDLSGNLLTNGAITMYYSSDRRLKHNIRTFNAAQTLLSLGGVYEYEYSDAEVAKNPTYAGTHYGLIYQNVKGTALGSMCYEREDGMGQLNYLSTKFLSLIAGATMENTTEIEKLKKENIALRKRVKQLEERLA